MKITTEIVSEPLPRDIEAWERALILESASEGLRTDESAKKRSERNHWLAAELGLEARQVAAVGAWLTIHAKAVLRERGLDNSVSHRGLVQALYEVTQLWGTELVEPLLEEIAEDWGRKVGRELLSVTDLGSLVGDLAGRVQAHPHAEDFERDAREASSTGDVLTEMPVVRPESVVLPPR